MAMHAVSFSSSSRTCCHRTPIMLSLAADAYVSLARPLARRRRETIAYSAMVDATSSSAYDPSMMAVPSGGGGGGGGAGSMPQQQQPQGMAAGALVRRPSLSPVLQAQPPQPVVVSMSQVVGKQVITRSSGRDLGTVTCLWVNPVQGEVVSLDLEERAKALSVVGSAVAAVGSAVNGGARSANVHLARLVQIGDVVLVNDEQVLYDQPLDGRYGYVILAGMEVRTRGGDFLGKVRDFAFCPDSGALSRLTYDDFGLAFLPSAFFDTFSVAAADVLTVGPGGVIVGDEAKYRERRESSGLFAAIPSLLRSIGNGGSSNGVAGLLSAPSSSSQQDPFLPQGYTYDQWEMDVRRWEMETGLSYDQYVRNQKQPQLPGGGGGSRASRPQQQLGAGGSGPATMGGGQAQQQQYRGGGMQQQQQPPAGGFGGGWPQQADGATALPAMQRPQQFRPQQQVQQQQQQLDPRYRPAGSSSSSPPLRQQQQPQQPQYRGAAPEQPQYRGAAPEQPQYRGAAPEQPQYRGAAPQRIPQQQQQRPPPAGQRPQPSPQQQQQQQQRQGSSPTRLAGGAGSVPASSPSASAAAGDPGQRQQQPSSSYAPSWPPLDSGGAPSASSSREGALPSDGRPEAQGGNWDGFYLP